MSQIFYHTSPVDIIGFGPMGLWLRHKYWPETRYLVPSGVAAGQRLCIGNQPFWGQNPCPVCGRELVEEDDTDE